MNEWIPVEDAELVHNSSYYVVLEGNDEPYIMRWDDLEDLFKMENDTTVRVFHQDSVRFVIGVPMVRFVPPMTEEERFKIERDVLYDLLRNAIEFNEPPDYDLPSYRNERDSGTAVLKVKMDFFGKRASRIHYNPDHYECVQNLMKSMFNRE